MKSFVFELCQARIKKEEEKRRIFVNICLTKNMFNKIQLYFIKVCHLWTALTFHRVVPIKIKQNTISRIQPFLEIEKVKK